MCFTEQKGGRELKKKLKNPALLKIAKYALGMMGSRMMMMYVHGFNVERVKNGFMCVRLAWMTKEEIEEHEFTYNDGK